MEENLRSGGIETFLPLIRARRARRNYRYTEAAPLFPQYLFARFDPRTRLRDVSFTRGVQVLLRAGQDLAVVDDTVVVFLRSRMDGDGLIRIGEPLHPGERVIIEDGPFAALMGVVERCLPERDRVTVLLLAVRAAVRVDVALQSVRRLGVPIA